MAKFATDALLLGALSAAGFCVAFAYEVGYARHFGYPTYLISPTPNVIVTALGVVLGAALFLLPLLTDLFDSSVSSVQRKASFWIIFIVFCGLLVGYVFVTNNYQWASLWTVGLGAVTGVIMHWGDKSNAKRGSVSGPKVRVVFSGFLLLVGIYYLASLLGTQAARDQKAFFFLQGKPDFAVVRLYDSLAIAIRYDFEKQQFVHEYLVFKLGDERKEMRLERVVLKEKRLPVVPDDQ